MKTLLILTMLLFMGCSSAADANSVNKPITGTIIDYGNGVYYFDSAGADFANSLSNFIKGHPNTDIISIAGNGRGSYGHDLGYFVVTKSR